MIVKLYNRKTGFTFQERIKASESVEDVVARAGAPKRLGHMLKPTHHGQSEAKLGTWTLTVVDGVKAPVESL